MALDAPCVAILWQSLLAQSLGRHPSFPEAAILGLGCWSIYATDYLADALFAAGTGALSNYRHEFYRRHQSGIAILIDGAALSTGISALNILPSDVIWNGIIVCGLIVAYLAAIHFTDPKSRSRWPREFAMSALFASGTFLCFSTGSIAQNLQLVTPTMLLSQLCWLNSSAIEYHEWQTGSPGSAHKPSASACYVWLHAPQMAAVIAVLAAIASWRFALAAPFATAVAFSSLVLCLLSRAGDSLGPNTFRAAADLALCSPALLLFFPHW